jgi:hypothetical protein
MIKVKVHVKNNVEYMDENVFVEIELPTLPRIGETLFLGKLTENLRIMATKSICIAYVYCPRWFFGKSARIDEVKEENLEDLSFEDLLHITDIRYIANSNDIDIEMD